MTIWGRRVRVEVEGVIIEDLDVKFEVAMEEGNLAKAEVSIYNLNAEHRAQIGERSVAEVSLSAGYADQELSRLFRGDMTEAFSVRESPDWITTLRTAGGKEVPQVRWNQSYAAGTSKETMWQDLVRAFQDAGIDPGNAMQAFAKGEFKDGIATFLAGGAAQGPAWPQMKKLARSAGLELEVQNKELVVTKIGEPLDATEIYLSPTTGLIGSPKKGVDGALQVRALLLPGLQPRKKVYVNSSLVDGLYAITKAKYIGDTAGQDWYADLECQSIAGATPVEDFGAA